jgi:hypothetical protein
MVVAESDRLSPLFRAIAGGNRARVRREAGRLLKEIGEEIRDLYWQRRVLAQLTEEEPSDASR